MPEMYPIQDGKYGPLPFPRPRQMSQILASIFSPGGLVQLLKHSQYDVASGC